VNGLLPSRGTPRAQKAHKRLAGQWKKDVKLAIAQGQRWQRREPFALIEIVSTNGMRATLQEMDQAHVTRKLR
jgi:hypothetical protein